jgi:hypothetical protein
LYIIKYPDQYLISSKTHKFILMEVIMMTPIKNLSLFALVFMLSVALLTLPIPLIVSPAQAQGQSVCSKNLADAEQRYNTGRFDDAIGLITECLGKRGISEEEKMKAYRLLGLSYIAKDYLEDAKTAVKKLLDMVPNYQSDPVQDPPPFTKLVEEVKEQQKPQEKPQQPAVKEPVKKQPDELTKLTQTESKKKSNKKWYFIGGGVLAAGAIVAIVASSGGDNGPTTPSALPGPPTLP